MGNDKNTTKKKFKRPLLNKVVNVFISLFGVLLFLVIIFFGFSQTKTFRNYLKNEISESVSQSVKGDLIIETIEGSVLSSVILKNTSLTLEQDTMFKAEEIVVKTSPVHLFLKRILIRDIVLKNANINLSQDSLGVWNLSKLSGEITESDKQAESIDSSDSPFPFSIQINNLTVENLNFTRQTYENVNSRKNYKFLTYNDLQLRELNLDAKVFINLSSSLARLKLNNFSVNPNFEAFNLNELSGEFELTENYASVKNLLLVSDSSNIKVNAKMDDLNLLGGVELREFKDYPMNVDLEAMPIKFSDLYTFIEDIDFLDEKVFLNLKANGYFGDFTVEKLDLSFLNSFINLTGKVEKLHTPEDLYLDVKIRESEVVEAEAHKLIKGLNIPIYENLVIKNLNATFKGEPTKFTASVKGDIDEGKIDASSYLNLQNEQIEYDLNYDATKINLFPIIGFNTSITSVGKIKGLGTDPNQMDADLNIQAFESVFDSVNVDSLYFTTTIKSRLLDLDINSLVNGADIFVEGKLDLRNDEHPIYDLTGTINNLHLENFTQDQRDSSNLNLKFVADGSHLEIDKMLGNYEITLEPSYLRDLKLDTTSIKLTLQKEQLTRKISLKSEFADFYIDGQFSLEKAIDILSYEGRTIVNVIDNKINELNPITGFDNLERTNSEDEIPAIVNENLEFNFNFLFKDFDLIAEFLKNDELDIVGSGEGTVKNDSLHFEISTDLYIDNLLNKKKNDIIYLSEIEAYLNFSRDNRVVSFNKMFGSVSIEGSKIYAGLEVNEIITDLVFNQSKLFFNTSFSLEDGISSELEGVATTQASYERIDISNILISYKDLPWVNFDTCTVLFNDDGVQLSNLIMNNGSTVINVDGQVNKDESHNFFANIESMPGEVLSTYLFEKGTQPLGGDINLDVVSSGFLKNPEIILDLNIFDITYNNVNFGSLFMAANHENNSTLFDVDFINTKLRDSSPLLTLDASIPLNINYILSEQLLDEESNINISLRSNNFDIGTFGNVLPYIRNQYGNLSSAIDFRGPINDLQTKGYLSLSDARFTLRENNLDYGVSIQTNFEEQTATLEDFSLKNIGGSRYSGEIKGIGNVKIDKFPFSEFDFVFDGNLALLGKKSQTKNANIYGDLLVESEDKLEFKFKDDRFLFKGDVIVERADLKYASKKILNDVNNNRVIYKILQDTSKINISNQKFVRILNETKLNTIDLDEDEKSKFDINTNIIFDNVASFEFLLAPNLNQRLSIETTGKLEFETNNNETRAQGTLTLQEGSRLDFFKPFSAVGTIRFENDLTDPFFNIVATYTGEIENFENTDRTVEVAVKFKILSAFSTLKENLSDNKQNLTVYVGRSQIENDTPNLRYDQSNALTFIIFDQLSLNLNNEQRSALASMTGNAAFSLLSSQLTNYLSNSLGGLINNIQLNRYSTRDAYKLLFSGKYNNIRYSFGGSFGSQTDYLQLNQADIRVEYLFNPNFLIRLEQKDPIIESTNPEKIQEVGIKYKFEF